MSFTTSFDEADSFHRGIQLKVFWWSTYSWNDAGFGRTRWGLSLARFSSGWQSTWVCYFPFCPCFSVLLDLQSPSKVPVSIKADQTSFSESTPCRTTSCKLFRDFGTFRLAYALGNPPAIMVHIAFFIPKQISSKKH